MPTDTSSNRSARAIQRRNNKSSTAIRCIFIPFARNRLHTSENAADQAQETFLSFLELLNDFRYESSFESYLFTILRRRIINTMRSSK